jgi:alkanesulfonate monooxygenase SsuD/methylene tetrahydromethanopterin reductase-like flavin-dependent oxidoreductase (luciferase family)
MPVMSGFRVGLGNEIVNSRYSATAFARADYLTAMATGLDAYRVGDHLNALFPRSIYTPEYVGVAKVAPTVDACLEPWTLLGHLASRTRFGRVRLGVGVHRRQSPQPRSYRTGRRDAASDYPGPRHPRHWSRGARRQRTL